MKIGVRIVNVTLLFGFFIFFAKCNAPRENPVDPKNPDNKLATLEGTVKRQGFPFPPIAGINVIWQNENIVLSTDAAGKFNFEHIERKNGLLKISGAGFSEDSIFIEWSGRKFINEEISLNSEPELNSLDFYSIVVNRFQFQQIYQIVVNAGISDFEGINDIDSVFISNSELNIRAQLLFNSISRLYERTFSLSELNVTDLDEVIGKNFSISVIDLNNRSFVIGTTNIKRVIKEEIELTSPLGNDTVTIPYTLRWKRFIPGFSFNYDIEIQTNESQPVLLYRAENIPPDSITHTIYNSINETNVFWTIWAIDEFKNRTRSKPGTFRIQE